MAAYCSAACFMRNNSIGLSAAAPTVDISTNSPPGGPGCVDQVGVAVAINSRGRVGARSVEAVDRRHDDIDPGDRRSEALAISDVADHHRDGAPGKMLGASGFAGKNAHLEVPLDEAIDEQGAQPAGPAGDEDHD